MSATPPPKDASEDPAAPAPAAPRVYNIPSYMPFLDTVASGILAQAGNDPLKLADYTIVVPDEDAVLALRQAFASQFGGKTSVMPFIGTPGDVDNDRFSLRISDDAELSQELAVLPPAVSHLYRQMVLAQEILKIPGMASSPEKAIMLGGELGRFLDELQRNDIVLKDVEKLAPEAFKDQWQKTADFLRIITDTWPKKLQQLGQIDPEERRRAVTRIQAEHWRRKKMAKPVVAVGFNEDCAATKDILRSVVALPAGAVVFQGLDLELDAKSWDAITPVHPQHISKSVLAAIGAKRDDVKEWPVAALPADPAGRAANPARANRERQKLLREAMRPAATAESWTALRAGKGKKNSAKTAPAKAGIDVQALNGLDMITCGTQQEESSVIALKMRENLETPGRTVTLVTEDRALARRVSARLRRWGIDVHDAAGTPLSDTPVGVFLLSTAAMAAEEMAPVPLLEALKHPLAAMGADKADFRRKVSELEDKALRGPRPGVGPDGLKNALTAAFNNAARRPKQGQTPEQIAAAGKELQDFVAGIETVGRAFFEKMASTAPVPFRDLLEEHIRFAELLAADVNEMGDARLWRGDDGVKAARFLRDLLEVADVMPAVTGRDYLDVLQSLMFSVSVQNRTTTHPVLKIMTPEQARLLKSDVIILGGLTEGVWPKRIDANPWLSPDMIKTAGLPPPETEIGREAHGFAQAISNPNVLLTRALRTSDGPTVASPFLVRLMMIVRGAGLEEAFEKKTPLLQVHMEMYTPAQVVPVDPPHVTPPKDKRPQKLSVTGVEALMRDPYAVYVKEILKLREKEPLDASPGAADRGIFIHAALEKFVKKYPGTLPANAEENLLKIGQEVFQERINNPTVRAFWWPRFERIAKWFVKFEKERRDRSKLLGAEVHGKLEIDMGDGIFTLTTSADRIERDENDQLIIIDYKTGSVPSQKSVNLGFSPQLPLEALVAFSGGFDAVDATDVGKLQYWKLSGGRPAAEVTQIKGDVKKLITEARDGIRNLIKTFNDPATPYLVAPRPDWAPRHGSARHLSRIDEWSTVKKTAPAKKKSTARRSTANKRRGRG